MMRTAPVTIMPDSLDHPRPTTPPDTGVPVCSERTEVKVKGDRVSQMETPTVSSPSPALHMLDAGLS